VIEVGEGRRGTKSVGDIDIRDVTGVEQGGQVRKMGRTTRSTVGHMRYTQVHILNLPRFPGKAFTFRAILSTQDNGTAGFCMRGDSGGPIARDRSAIGLIQGFGDVEDGELRGTLFTIFQVLEGVLKRIEEKFGEKFVLADERNVVNK
jgi:hypothetical protein